MITILESKDQFRRWVASATPLELIDICARIKKAELTDYNRRYSMRACRVRAQRLGVRGVV